MKTKHKDAVIPVRIPQELLRKLDKLAESQDRSRSYIVRKLLQWGVEEEFDRMFGIDRREKKGGKQ